MKQTSKRVCALLLIVSLMAGMLVMSVSATGGDGAKIVSQQLSLGDDLTMCFCVTVDSQYVDTATASTSVNGDTKTQSIKDITPNEDGSYPICVELAAAQMTDEITLVIAAGDTVLAEGVYSIRDYAEYLLEGNYTDATKQMVKEMLNYGAKAQSYFDYNMDNLANAGYEIESTAEVPAPADLEMVTGSEDGITYYGATLVFASKIALRFYFNIAGDIGDYTFSTGSEPVEKSNGLYYVEVDQINPQDYANLISLTVNDSLTVNYSPLTYINRMYAKESASTELKDLMQAMYGYYLEAEEFTGVEENEPEDTREVVKATVSTGWLLGTYVSDGDVTKAYDGDTTTKWNPQSGGYKSGEGVAFKLDAAYDLTKIEITFSAADMYADVYVSDTGETYELVASVNADNLDTYYVDGAAVCTVDALDSLTAQFVKINFTGRAGGSAWINFFEIEVYGKEVVVEAPEDTREVVKATVSTGWLLGTYVSNGDVTKAYDGDTTTKWNPQSGGYKSGEGVAFKLDAAYDLTKIEITFSAADMYVDVYVSDTGETYELVASVNADNLDTYYVDGAAICTVDGLDSLASQFVKIDFTGRAGGSAWINFFEIEVYGKECVAEESEDTREEVKATVTESYLQGTYVSNGDMTKAYDGDTSTKWNPQTGGYASGEGVVFKLDNIYDLTKIILTFSTNDMYFDLYVSDATGEIWTQIASVNSDTVDTYYTEGTGVCTVDGLDNLSIQFVKLNFTGRANGSAWINFFEIEVYGKEVTAV